MRTGRGLVDEVGDECVGSNPSVPSEDRKASVLLKPQLTLFEIKNRAKSQGTKRKKKLAPGK